MGTEVFCLAGAAVMYHTKWIIVICTIPTEAGFVVCVHRAKNNSYLRSILQHTVITQVGPTIIYVDNIAAMVMANAGKPTERSRHIDIQLFALLSWVKMVMGSWNTSKVPATHQTPSPKLLTGFYITTIDFV
jgi:hypothetical protein